MGHIVITLWHALYKAEAIKGQVITDFLAEYPIQKSSNLYKDIQDEVVKANMTSDEQDEQLFFDGASWIGSKERMVAGVGVIFVSPQNHIILRAYSLIESHSKKCGKLQCSVNWTKHC